MVFEIHGSIGLMKYGHLSPKIIMSIGWISTPFFSILPDLPFLSYPAYTLIFFTLGTLFPRDTSTHPLQPSHRCPLKTSRLFCIRGLSKSHFHSIPDTRDMHLPISVTDRSLSRFLASPHSAYYAHEVGCKTPIIIIRIPDISLNLSHAATD